MFPNTAFIVAPAPEFSDEILRHYRGFETKAHQFCDSTSGAYSSPRRIIRRDADEQVAWEKRSLHRRKLTSYYMGLAG